jgi:hypothetical protein
MTENSTIDNRQSVIPARWPWAICAPDESSRDEQQDTKGTSTK